MLLVGFVLAGLVSLWLLRLRRGRAAFTVAAFMAALPALLLTAGTASAAPAPVLLATSANYSVLGASTVTNTGASVLNESVGLWPGTSITGFPPGVVTPPAVIDNNNAAAQQAQSDLTTAYNDAAGRPLSATTTADLAGYNLPPGVYAGPSKGALALGGTLTLNGGGDPSSVFIFQTDSTLITATDSSVMLTNGAQECNVFWQVGSSATLGTNSVFAGNILANTSVTANTGAVVHGRALARTAAVTLDTNTFTSPTCAQVLPTTTTAGGSTTTAVGPTTTAGGPTTTAGGPTTTAGGPTTTAGGSTTTAGGSDDDGSRADHDGWRPHDDRCWSDDGRCRSDHDRCRSDHHNDVATFPLDNHLLWGFDNAAAGGRRRDDHDARTDQPRTPQYRVEPTHSAAAGLDGAGLRHHGRLVPPLRDSAFLRRGSQVPRL